MLQLLGGTCSGNSVALSCCQTTQVIISCHPRCLGSTDKQTERSYQRWWRLPCNRSISVSRGQLSVLPRRHSHWQDGGWVFTSSKSDQPLDVYSKRSTTSQHVSPITQLSSTRLFLRPGQLERDSCFDHSGAESRICNDQ